jgi:CrcB protein
MIRLLLVMIGGAFGSGARYVLSDFVQRRMPSSLPYFPAGTFAVNLVGCFAFGAIAQVGLERTGIISPSTRLFLLMGICGGFTTFSSFGYETFRLLQDGELAIAALNVVGQVVGGIAALWAGMALARLI